MALMLTISTLLFCLFELAHAGTYPPDAVDHLAQTGLRNLQKYISNTTNQGECTLENAARRYEW